MASLSSLFIKTEMLEELLIIMQKKIRAGQDVKGITLTIAHSDAVNEYKQDISAWVEQSEEARKANKPRYYVGNGRMYWKDNPSPITQPAQAPQAKREDPKSDDNDLPF